MWNMLRIIIILILLITSISCGFLGVIAAIKFSTDHVPNKEGRKLRLVYFIASIITGFIAFSLYSKTFICYPILLILIGLVITEFLISKCTYGFLKRK
jgi:hypothetical protein